MNKDGVKRYAGNPILAKVNIPYPVETASILLKANEELAMTPQRRKGNPRPARMLPVGDLGLRVSQ